MWVQDSEDRPNNNPVKERESSGESVCSAIGVNVPYIHYCRFKAQCYYASTVQITALILFHQKPKRYQRLVEKQLANPLTRTSSIAMCHAFSNQRLCASLLIPHIYHTLGTPFRVCDRLFNDHCPPGYSDKGLCVLSL